MIAEVVAAVLVGFALFWLVAQPLVAPGLEAVVVDEPPDPEETPRGQALLALKEIEFDRARFSIFSKVVVTTRSST